jgi:hypothetical protein
MPSENYQVHVIETEAVEAVESTIYGKEVERENLVVSSVNRLLDAPESPKPTPLAKVQTLKELMTRHKSKRIGAASDVRGSS